MALREERVLLYETLRCWECGCYWAIEQSYNGDGDSPRCAQRARLKRNGERHELERSNASLRGVITRLRKKAR